MKNILKMMFVLALLAAFVPKVSTTVFAVSFFAGGDGSEANPYLIETALQLDAVRGDLDAHYALMNDVDLSTYIGVMGNLEPAFSLGWDPIGDHGLPFTGSLDGRGHKISGLVFFVPDGDPNTYELGLFGAIRNSTIYNIDIEGEVSIQHDEFVALGFIATTAVDSIISGVNVSGTISVYNEANHSIGGVVAEAENSSFINMSVDVALDTLSSNSTGGVVGIATQSLFRNVVNHNNILAFRGQHTGGIVGHSTSSSFTSVRNHGDVLGFEYTGGIVGWASFVSLLGVANSGDIETFGDHAGGIIGKLEDEYENTRASDYQFELIFNEGQVSSRSNNPDVRLGSLIGMMEFQVYAANDTLTMMSLFDTSTTLPLVGYIVDSENSVNFRIRLMVDRSTSSEFILTSTPNLGLITIVDESSFVEPDDLDAVALAINNFGHDVRAVVESNVLILDFEMSVYLTQGKANGPISFMLVWFSSRELTALPSSARSIPSFEVFNTLVEWDFTDIIGWNTNRSDTGDIFYPEDTLVYVRGVPFIRLFATDVVPIVEEEPPVDDEDEELPDTSDPFSWVSLMLGLGFFSLLLSKKIKN
jgi:hypothetical protein